LSFETVDAVYRLVLKFRHHFTRILATVTFMLISGFICLLYRNFNAGVYLLAWSQKREDVVGLKAPKKEKRVKKENRTQPPVEAPYVAPKTKISIKPVPDKTVEIFDGMTLLDLSKRTGAYISTLQGILADLGEKVESEFDSISIDLAELVAMVCLNFLSSNYINLYCSIC
jgi:hypothetical protein